MLIERKPMEVTKSIEKLEYITRQLKMVFKPLEEAEEKGDYDPFIEISYNDVVELKDSLVSMLREYEDLINSFVAGDILFNVESHKIQANPAALRSGENAPAYKKDIDEKKIYQLHKSGFSLNRIAKLVGCSPDTVKRRIYKMQQEEKKK